MLGGVLEALFPGETKEASPSKISHFIACTNTQGSAQKLQKQLGRQSPHVEILHQANVAAMEQADVVILGVKPYLVKDVLEEAGVREALAGKLLMSMIPIPASDLRSFVRGNNTDGTQEPWFVKAIPNVGARYGQSMTIMDAPDSPLPAEEQEFVEWFWNLIGSLKVVSPSLSNAAMMNMTATLAGMSIALEGLLDGSVKEGLRRNDATDIAIQSMKSLVAVLENGTHPSVLRESMASPRGCTIATILSLEKAGVRGTFAQAFLDGAEIFADKK